jgi:hypothetical protein
MPFSTDLEYRALKYVLDSGASPCQVHISDLQKYVHQSIVEFSLEDLLAAVERLWNRDLVEIDLKATGNSAGQGFGYASLKFGPGEKYGDVLCHGDFAITITAEGRAYYEQLNPDQPKRKIGF